jgi:hypothetical protein
MVLKLTNGAAAPAPVFTFYAAAAAANTLAGGASTRVVNTTVTVVGFVGNGGTLTFTGVDGGAAGGTKLLSFDYINGDFVFSNTACSNCRNAFVSVNGGTPVQAQMPISAQVSGACLMVLLLLGYDMLYALYFAFPFLFLFPFSCFAIACTMPREMRGSVH